MHMPYHHLGQSDGKVAGLPMQKNHSDCSRVAQHALVLGSSDHQIPLCSPHLPNLLTQPFNQTPHRKSVKTKSEAVAARIEVPQRESTKSVY